MSSLSEMALPNTPSFDKATIRILCVCEMGNVRSVGTRRRLNRRGYRNVIAIGAINTNDKTLAMLYKWADKILIAEPWMGQYLPDDTDNKIVKEFTIGPDVFGNPIKQSLQDIIKTQLDKIGLR